MTGRRSDSGDGDEYTYDEVDEFYDFWDEEFGDYYESNWEQVGGTLTVTAQVEWGGSVMDKNDGVRTVHLDQLTPAQLANIQEGFANAAGSDNWGDRYKAVANSDAARRAGLNPSRTTARRWARGTQRPSKANQERIRNAAKQDAVDRVTQELRRSYGANVRFRRIEDMHLE